MATPTERPDAPDPTDRPRPPPAAGRRWPLLRNTWRGLTSHAHRAGAAVPARARRAARARCCRSARSTSGWSTSTSPTTRRSAPVLDRLGFFDVFAAPWFAAIYLLLFVSLVGCLLPRTVEHARALRAEPVATPRNLPGCRTTRRATLDVGAGRGRRARSATRLRGLAVASERAGRGGRTHLRREGLPARGRQPGVPLRLLGLLRRRSRSASCSATRARSSCWPTAASSATPASSATTRSGRACASTAPSSTRSASGSTTSPPTTCRTGRPRASAPTSATRPPRTWPPARRPWRPYPLEVNHPLRARRRPGLPARPRLRAAVHRHLPGRPAAHRRRSSGARSTRRRCCPRAPPSSTRPASPTTSSAARSQLADHRPVRADLAPAATSSPRCSRTLRDPEVAVDVLRGDLGLDDGRGQSIFEVRPVAWSTPGALVRVARANLVPGEELTPRRRHRRSASTACSEWVSLQVSHDPAQAGVLRVRRAAARSGSALSLTVRRRRFWVRLTPAGRHGQRPYRRRDRRAGPHRPGRLRRGVRPAAGGSAGDHGATRPEES